ncbi:hypothetical protein [Bauldia sp.]|uniref:hypothetical protein n=1 Tax=Bauldia sp. TaxID=2575872 RepID=UPI003BAA6FC4
MVTDGEKVTGVIVGVAIPVAVLLANGALNVFSVILGAVVGTLIWRGHHRRSLRRYFGIGRWDA